MRIFIFGLYLLFCHASGVSLLFVKNWQTGWAVYAQIWVSSGITVLPGFPPWYFQLSPSSELILKYLYTNRLWVSFLSFCSDCHGGWARPLEPQETNTQFLGPLFSETKLSSGLCQQLVELFYIYNYLFLELLSRFYICYLWGFSAQVHFPSAPLRNLCLINFCLFFVIYWIKFTNMFSF